VPTIVTLIEEKTDVSAFYNFAEEELHKQIKELKAEVKSNYNNELLTSVFTVKSKIISENRSKHDAILEEIFSPPPELI
jgi:hypothetical protein